MARPHFTDILCVGVGDPITVDSITSGAASLRRVFVCQQTWQGPTQRHMDLAKFYMCGGSKTHRILENRLAATTKFRSST